MTTKFKRGDKVLCNGNPDGRVLGYYSERMVEVRLWDGLRHVGDVCVDERELTPFMPGHGFGGTLETVG